MGIPSVEVWFPMVELGTICGLNGMGEGCTWVGMEGEGTREIETCIDICNMFDYYKNIKFN